MRGPLVSILIRLGALVHIFTHNCTNVTSPVYMCVQYMHVYTPISACKLMQLAHDSLCVMVPLWYRQSDCSLNCIYNQGIVGQA